VRVRLTALLLAAVAVLAATAFAAQSPLPPKPADYVLDKAGIFTPSQEAALTEKLKQYERETSNQLVVAVLPRVPDDYAMEDFTQRTAEAWGAGQKRNDNGMVLFVFPESRQMRIEVGYGLEGAVPDALANNIIRDEMVPAFRAGNMASGIVRGAEALMSAAQGEYKGTGRTVGEGPEEAVGIPLIWLILLIFVIVTIHRSQTRGGRVYHPMGQRDVWFPSNGTGLGGRGGFGGGGFGGGGFSGGGGGFGGGGASGQW